MRSLEVRLSIWELLKEECALLGWKVQVGYNCRNSMRSQEGMRSIYMLMVLVSKVETPSDSTVVEKIVDRYNSCPDPSDHATVEDVAEPEVNALKDEIAKLRLVTGRMMGKELDGMDFKELQQLEHQLTEAILSIKNKKEQVLLELLEKSNLQIEELRHNSCNHYPENSQAARKISGGSSTLVCDYNSDREEDSDTSLRLGLSVATSQKKKVPKIECTSNDSA
ncbi:hypothetical protein K7X08_007515 [Anisodus acutangulus]|uniref:K-box domain-containing protein n=1 Tax=Anisodus acutangulus TaxID=402998 RepID=A0A9Q1LD84_9SOLA|nr:hypothetical protein K7X08_007515 [Anisodus acutangulus]